MTHPPAEPRDGSISIGGIPWLARMIDKSRLEAAGQIDTFDLDYPCPMDQRLLSQLGINSKVFQTITTTHKSDAEILEALKKEGASLPA
ncbi:MAG: DUF5069 domain-containing protein [Cyanobacteria bacterium]|nr:DUF5069 domain-containing protein [Cyanobacteriota bacterium]